MIKIPLKDIERQQSAFSRKKLLLSTGMPPSKMSFGDISHHQNVQPSQKNSIVLNRPVSANVTR